MSTFGGRDLANLLSDEVDPTAIRFNTSSKDETVTFKELVPKIDKSKKIVRYFPQKAPAWTDQKESVVPSVGLGPVVEDKRLSRLARVTETSSAEPTRRRRYEAEVIESFDVVKDDELKVLLSRGVETTEVQLDDKDIGEEDIMMRRARIRDRMAAKEEVYVAVEARPAPAVAESGESEYETDSDDDYDEEEEREILKPVFVPRAKRETILERERKLAEEDAVLEKKHLEQEERKKQTRVMVAESVRRLDDKSVQDAATDADSDAGLPDDTDGVDNEQEFELWRIRELTRLKRDAELREAIEKEKAEVVRWRNMSEEERRSEDARLSQDKPVKEKEKWRFMQKYYHKGVFYMDEDSVKKEERDVRTLEFSAPTLEDHVDKEKLPAIMQVKKFGMRGRTKYTHLVDQDTTRFGPDAHQPDARVMQSYLNKRGGVGDLNDAGRRKKITRHET